MIKLLAYQDSTVMKDRRYSFLNPYILYVIECELFIEHIPLIPSQIIGRTITLLMYTAYDEKRPIKTPLSVQVVIVSITSDLTACCIQHEYSCYNSRP